MAEWTDERMDDLARRVDAGFARNDRQIEALRTETREGFRDVRTEFRGDIGELRTLAFRFGIALVVGLVGLIAALAGAIATGALSA